MNQKLVKIGIKLNLFLHILWKFLTLEEKEELSLKQCLLAWKRMRKGSTEKNEAWKFVKLKLETFEECQWAWKQIPSGRLEKGEVLQLAKVKAETANQRFWIFEKNYLYCVKRLAKAQKTKFEPCPRAVEEAYSLEAEEEKNSPLLRFKFRISSNSNESAHLKKEWTMRFKIL